MGLASVAQEIPSSSVLLCSYVRAWDRTSVITLGDSFFPSPSALYDLQQDIQYSREV